MQQEHTHLVDDLSSSTFPKQHRGLVTLLQCHHQSSLRLEPYLTFVLELLLHPKQQREPTIRRLCYLILRCCVIDCDSLDANSLPANDSFMPLPLGDRKAAFLSALQSDVLISVELPGDVVGLRECAVELMASLVRCECSFSSEILEWVVGLVGGESNLEGGGRGGGGGVFELLIEGVILEKVRMLEGARIHRRRGEGSSVEEKLGRWMRIMLGVLRRSRRHAEERSGGASGGEDGVSSPTKGEGGENDLFFWEVELAGGKSVRYDRLTLVSSALKVLWFALRSCQSENHRSNRRSNRLADLFLSEDGYLERIGIVWAATFALPQPSREFGIRILSVLAVLGNTKVPQLHGRVIQKLLLPILRAPVAGEARLVQIVEETIAEDFVSSFSCPEFSEAVITKTIARLSSGATEVTGGFASVRENVLRRVAAACRVMRLLRKSPGRVDRFEALASLFQIVVEDNIRMRSAELRGGAAAECESDWSRSQRLRLLIQIFRMVVEESLRTRVWQLLAEENPLIHTDELSRLVARDPFRLVLSVREQLSEELRNEVLYCLFEAYLRQSPTVEVEVDVDLDSVVSSRHNVVCNAWFVVGHEMLKWVVPALTLGPQPQQQRFNSSTCAFGKVCVSLLRFATASLCDLKNPVLQPEWAQLISVEWVKTCLSNVVGSLPPRSFAKTLLLCILSEYLSSFPTFSGYDSKVVLIQHLLSSIAECFRTRSSTVEIRKGLDVLVGALLRLSARFPEKARVVSQRLKATVVQQVRSRSSSSIPEMLLGVVRSAVRQLEYLRKYDEFACPPERVVFEHPVFSPSFYTPSDFVFSRAYSRALLEIDEFEMDSKVVSMKHPTDTGPVTLSFPHDPVLITGSLVWGVEDRVLSVRFEIVNASESDMQSVEAIILTSLSGDVFVGACGAEPTVFDTLNRNDRRVVDRRIRIASFEEIDIRLSLRIPVTKKQKGTCMVVVHSAPLLVSLKCFLRVPSLVLFYERDFERLFAVSSSCSFAVHAVFESDQDVIDTLGDQHLGQVFGVFEEEESSSSPTALGTAFVKKGTWKIALASQSRICHTYVLLTVLVEKSYRPETRSSVSVARFKFLSSDPVLLETLRKSQFLAEEVFARSKQISIFPMGSTAFLNSSPESVLDVRTLYGLCDLGILFRKKYEKVSNRS